MTLDGEIAGEHLHDVSAQEAIAETEPLLVD